MALISVEDLQTRIFAQIDEHFRLPESENISSIQSVGRILAQDVVSSVNLPRDNVSAMDGYALPRAAKQGEVFEIVGESAAGKPFSGSLKSHECIRIMTGAVVPNDGVAVVMQENCEIGENKIVLQQDVGEKNNIRYAGEEIQAAATVLQKGRVLREADVMLLAAIGVSQVLVYKKIRVAILSTGDELKQAGEPLENGQIYDSNRPMLLAKMQYLPIEIMDLGKINDDFDAVQAALQHAAHNADVVLTSGGVSVGDYDYLRQVIEQIGQIHHYKAAIKPSKPIVFGQIGNAWYFGLGGNPISGFVGFDVFVKAALWQLCGANPVPQPLRFQAALSAPVKKAAGRTDFQRAVLSQQNDGTLTVAPCGSQDSHRIFGTSQANAYIILPQDCGNLGVGEMVEVQAFSQAFL